MAQPLPNATDNVPGLHNLSLTEDTDESIKLLTTKFQYQPLNSDVPEIRTIRVLQCSGDTDVISCEVEHIPVGPKPNNSQDHTNFRAGYAPSPRISYAYSALSYVWGQETASKEILLNGARFLVRPNLFKFLKTVTSGAFDQWLDPGARLWIDAICIDQHNTEERNSQVRFMSEIYSNALQVIIWLSEVNKQSVPSELSPYKFKSRESSSEDVMMFDKVCSQDYWTRLWIVQEVLLANEIKMVFGDTLVNFDMLANKKRRDCQATALYMWRFLNRGARVKPGLLEVIRTYGHRNCQETKDRLFALLSIVPNGTAFPLDYQDKVETIFWKALFFFVDKYGPRENDDAIAAGELLYNLFRLRHVREAPENLTRVSPSRSQPLPELSAPMDNSKESNINTQTSCNASQSSIIFPIKLSLLERNARNYFACFPYLRLCACEDCEDLQILKPSFDHAQQDLTWSNYIVCRVASIPSAVSILLPVKETQDYPEWQWVAFGMIREHKGRKQSLTIYPPPGGKSFLIRDTNQYGTKPRLVYVNSSALKDLSHYNVQYAHNQPAWRTCTDRSYRNGGQLQLTFGMEKDRGWEVVDK